MNQGALLADDKTSGNTVDDAQDFDDSSLERQKTHVVGSIEITLDLRDTTACRHWLTQWACIEESRRFRTQLILLSSSEICAGEIFEGAQVCTSYRGQHLRTIASPILYGAGRHPKDGSAFAFFGT